MIAPMFFRRPVLGGFAAAPVAQADPALGRPSALTAHMFRSPRHTTRYLEAGPANGPLMVFVHGWPEIGLMWRAQVEAFAAMGWRCIAPDMRGYGGSSAPAAANAYALEEIVQDIVQLHDHLGGRPAIWVGHDLGSPVIGALAAHHPERSRGVVFTSVPYLPGASHCQASCPWLTGSFTQPTNIPTDSGTTTVSTSPTSTKQLPTSTQTSQRLSRRSIGEALPRAWGRCIDPLRSLPAEVGSALHIERPKCLLIRRSGCQPILKLWSRRSA